MLVTIGNKLRNVDDRLSAFILYDTACYYTEYFGHDGKDRVFVQFRGGYCRVYSGVPAEQVQMIQTGKTIVLFIALLTVRAKAYPYVEYQDRLITNQTRSHDHRAA